MSTPLVSIITPTYNHEKYIAACIKSALAQTYSHWEMLVVNDGSTDNTAQIVKEYIQKDNRIRLFEQQNIGIFRLKETYNFALNKAHGKYIAILEGDDVWEKTKLEKQILALESDETMVLAWGTAHQANFNLTQIISTSPSTDDNEGIFFNNDPLGSMLNILFFKNCIPALTLLIRKDILMEIGGFHQGYGLPLVDLPTLQLLSTKGKFYFDPEPLGKWRVYANQTTKTYIAEIFEGFYSLALDNHKRFADDKQLSYHVKIEDIHSHFKNMLIMAYSRAGRYKLIRKQYRDARKDYVRSICLGGKKYGWKIRSVIGLVFSFLHLNIEWLARAINHPSYGK